jgi:hypothetical protein
VSRRAFERWLRQNGARFLRHGATHDIWTKDGKTASVPRHREIKRGTMIAICGQLEIPTPR